MADMSAADLGVGIRALLESGNDWPPSLPGFRAMCRPAKRENAAMYRLPPSHQLPHKLSDEARAAGRQHIAKLKAGLTDA